jgi:hypothetical protein
MQARYSSSTNVVGIIAKVRLFGLFWIAGLRAGSPAIHISTSNSPNRTTLAHAECDFHSDGYARKEQTW